MNKLITDLKYIHFKEIDSTHLYARNNAHLYNGNYAFIADIQTNGIGKGQRVWLSANGNLYVSMLIPFLGNATFISLLIACAIHKVIAELSPFKNVQLHWPNDVYINNKKVCGILLEIVDGNKLIISFGINTVSIPTGVHGIAEKLDNISNDDLFLKIINKINELYNAFCIDKSGLIEYWNKNVLGLNKQIVIKCRNACIEGLFNRIDDSGRIVVTCYNGEEKKVATGDMFVV